MNKVHNEQAKQSNWIMARLWSECAYFRSLGSDEWMPYTMIGHIEFLLRSYVTKSRYHSLVSCLPVCYSQYQFLY